MLQPTKSHAAFAFSSWIDGISPAKGGNTGEITVSIMGHFTPPITRVNLQASDGTEINGTIVDIKENSYVIDWEDETRGDIIMVNFDLTGVPPGHYTVRVLDDSGGGFLVCPSPFTIETGKMADLWVNITGQPWVRFGAVTDYLIWYGNRGNPDELRSGVLFIGIPKELNYSLGFDPQDFTIREMVDTGGNPPEFDAYYGKDYRIIKLYIRDIPPSSLTPLKITIYWGNTTADHLLKAWWAGSKPDGYQPDWPDN